MFNSLVKSMSLSVPGQTPHVAGSSKATPRPWSRRVLSAPFLWWSLLGLGVILFEIYVFGSWITGPHFKPVPPGPTPIPEWMKVVLDVWQVAGLFGAAFVFYWFLFRPWRREGRVTTDGYLVIAFATLWFQDPLSAYFGHWFTYNTHLVNYGSWVMEVPGWQSFGEPGAMIAEPILLIGPVYVYFIMVATVLGCYIMGKIRARWPRIKTPLLLAICFVVMMLVDFVGEGLVWLPLGFWEYPGGIPLMFSDTYHKFPLNEMLTIAATFTSITAIRFFKDDRGDTLAERGVQRFLKDHGKLSSVVRGLAIIGVVHFALFLCYTVPNAFIYKLNIEWPKDLVNRSYLTDYICGPGTANQCPQGGQGFVTGTPAP